MFLVYSSELFGVIACPSKVCVNLLIEASSATNTTGVFDQIYFLCSLVENTEAGARVDLFGLVAVGWEGLRWGAGGRGC
jgi:hypothetical protein